MKPKKIISLEIPEDLYKAIKQEAFNNDKSTSAEIRDLLITQLLSNGRWYKTEENEIKKVL